MNSMRLYRLHLQTGTAALIFDDLVPRLSDTHHGLSESEFARIVNDPKHRAHQYVKNGGTFMLVPKWSPEAFGPCIFTVEPPKPPSLTFRVGV